MRETVQEMWPEIGWIRDASLREKVLETWVRALQRSPLKPEDLETIPFTLLVENCTATFMEHKRCVVHIARRAAESMREFLGHSLRIDMDTVIAGAILTDVGKLLEYEKVDGETRQSQKGKLLRHPFTGVALAQECGVPDEVCHVIATHTGEGDLIRRTVEATIVHYADFMSFDTFQSLS
ncbi:MAG: HD domain-containing protein [Planctomycetota bacterium]